VIKYDIIRESLIGEKSTMARKYQISYHQMLGRFPNLKGAPRI